MVLSRGLPLIPSPRSSPGYPTAREIDVALRDRDAWETVAKHYEAVAEDWRAKAEYWQTLAEYRGAVLEEGGVVIEDTRRVRVINPYRKERGMEGVTRGRNGSFVRVKLDGLKRDFEFLPGELARVERA